MKAKKISRFSLGGIVVLGVWIFLSTPLYPLDKTVDFSVKELDKKILEFMNQGDIPGLTLVVVRGESDVWIKGYGYADLKQRNPVTRETLFQLGSCSKAFTALAALQLAEEGLIHLDDPVSMYLPWFRPTYEGKEYPVTLRQLLHQTSGIPWHSIDLISRGSNEGALERTVRRLADIRLNHVPGTRFEYASANYDVIGLVIEKVTKLSYEDYMVKSIFGPLALAHTSVGSGTGNPMMATGYKIGFLKPRKYEAPPYRGNWPSGYIISNGIDIGRWLQLQMGLVKSDVFPYIQESHQRDEGVPPNPKTFSSYAMGWQRYVDGSQIIDHGGLNPTFTSYIIMDPKEKLAVAVLANSDSGYTAPIGRFVMKFVSGKGDSLPHVPAKGLDKVASLVSVLMALYLLCAVAFLISIVADVIVGRRRFEGLSLLKLAKILGMLLIFVPFLVGIHLLPQALSSVSWDTAVVWGPISFYVVTFLVLAAMGLSYVGFLFSSLFPMKNKYFRSLPMITILSLLSGGANAVVIFLITSSLFSNIRLIYQLYYFALAFFVYIVGRKLLQSRLLKITYNIVYDLRMRLIQKIFLTTYQKFEKLDRGRVYATLNNDTGQVGNSTNVLVRLVTSIITAVGAFAYLATIAFWATAITILVVVAIAVLFRIVTNQAQPYFEESRDTQNVYMGLLNGMLDGFKELSLQINKRREYRIDIGKSCDEYRNKTIIAMIKFVNAFLIGESMLVIVLGAVCFAIPRMFPDISTFTLMSFIMILLYLIGPITAILNSVPAIMQIRIAWSRIKSFEADIPANMEPAVLDTIHNKVRNVESIRAKNIEFEYAGDNEDEQFKVGPLDFEAKKGEITFIVGGNGSGKTTLAKLLTGLYLPDKGEISVDGPAVNNGHLGEYFSGVFSDYHLFPRLYNVDMRNIDGKVKEYLEMLGLKDKVGVRDNAVFSTIALSGGQRKRLALLQVYLENSPIYMFDEVAADQDPEFRKFFYHELLLQMKEEGKIVIAITHDDHYFNVADKIIKMDMGKIEKVETTK